MAPKLLVSSILMILANHVAQAKQQCDFPDYLGSLPDGVKEWIYMSKKPTHSLEAGSEYIVTVNRSVLSAEGRSYGAPFKSASGMMDFTYECLEKVGEKYLVDYNEANSSAPHYSCLQFIQKSPSVVLLLRGSLTLTMVECSRQSLTWDGWPLVLRRAASSNVELSGGNLFFDAEAMGFNVEFVDADDNLWCSSQSGSHVTLELSCGPYKTYRMSSPGHCQPPGLSIGDNQELLPLANFEIYGYTFVLLRTGGQTVCLRHQILSYKSISRGVMFLDAVCDWSDDLHQTDNYYFLNLLSDKSACEGIGCSGVNQSSGQFPEAVTGRWLGNSLSVININQISVSEENSHSRLTLLQRFESSAWPRYIMQYSNDKGCSGSLICLEIKPLEGTSSILIYRLSRTFPLLNNSYTDGEQAGHICESSAFQQTKKEQRIPTPYRFLTHQHYVEYSPCMLFDADSVYLFHEVLENGEICHGMMTRGCVKPWDLNIAQSDCQTWEPRTLICLGYLSGRHDVVILMEDQSKGFGHAKYCWIFNEDKNKISVKPVEECVYQVDVRVDSGLVMHGARELNLARVEVPGRCKREAQGSTTTSRQPAYHPINITVLIDGSARHSQSISNFVLTFFLIYAIV